MPVKTTVAHLLVERKIAEIVSMKIPTKEKRAELSSYINGLKFPLGSESKALVASTRTEWKNTDGRSRKERKLKKKFLKR